ncbi:5'/3'-nucleotidase SurE [Xanthobacteraceae bacterium Astr-EGSB]|uniref:5'/3'-nucleotidase SurE n=1 Tax=Astrobacterium formosum TaxID=3069710 RepID=UPI0027AE450D|nr:5'/3'-nucleotidase SurE [Xanthobacteraceae bacterium Astr-EGSB]
MRILVTNDDGIHAPGLEVCAEIARALSDDVWVVAPEFDQSGVSHSLSLNDPLRLRAVADKRFAVKGTPTDCVVMGVRHILADKPPDLILSGVNRGSNVADDVSYSGTIAGAIEGTILGIPAIALSQAYGAATKPHPHWPTAVRHGPDIVRRVLAEGIPAGVLVNVNFPDCKPEEVEGIAVAAQGKRGEDWLSIDPRVDGRGNAYFWVTFGRGPRLQPGQGTDLAALAVNRISVTPLRLDMTDEPFMTRLAQLFADAEAEAKPLGRRAGGER